MSVLLKEYKIQGKKGEGTFSEVLKCQKVADGKYYACKKMKQHYDSEEQVNNLREIQAMRRLNPHPNIISLYDVIFDKRTGTLALILELMDFNAYELIRGRKHYLPEHKVKNYMWQLCKAIDHMHKQGIFHRDVKPENILIREDSLKLADFGSCRSISSKHPYTEYISTRWYRAPECLLTDGYYSFQMDIWSVGCVIFEIMSLRPLFPGANEVDQIAKIHDVQGTPQPEVLKKFKNRSRSMSFNFPQKKGIGIERLLPHGSSEALDLIKKLCDYDPDKRITSTAVLKHPYFREYRIKETRSTPQTTPRSLPSVAASNKENISLPTIRSPAEHPPLLPEEPPKPSVVSNSNVNANHKPKEPKQAPLQTHINLSNQDQKDKDKEREWRKKRRALAPFHSGSTIPAGSQAKNPALRQYNQYKASYNKVYDNNVHNSFLPEISNNHSNMVAPHAAENNDISNPPHQLRKSNYLTHAPNSNRRHHLPSLQQNKYNNQIRAKKPGQFSLFFGHMRTLEK